MSVSPRLPGRGASTALTTDDVDAIVRTVRGVRVATAGVTDTAVMTRGDGTTSDGWLRCTASRRYSVSNRPGEPLVPPQAKRRR